MSRRLVHLNAIRAFEAVARHMSFAKAADELGVTPAAVSQQVKTLEDHLGVALFRRTKRAIFLTESAQAMLPEIREGFDRIGAGLSRVRARRARKDVILSVPPSFASKWLMQRLERFTARHPDLDIRLDARTTLVDFAREDVDLAVRYGGGEYPGLVSAPLLVERVFPVCAPKLLDGVHPLSDPRNLRHHTLIHDDTMGSGSDYPNWKAWLETAGVTDVDPSRGLHVNASAIAIQAAIDAQGVALGRSVLVEDDLAAGRLVRPFELSCGLRYAYHIVHPPRASANPAVVLLRDWLLGEAGAASGAQASRD